MKVLVLGPGRMGSQIGCEYALGGHTAWFVARRPKRARQRLDDALRVVRTHCLWPSASIDAAAERMVIVGSIDQVDGEVEIIVESIVEDLTEKGRILRPAAERWPAAIIASNTSAIPITSIGDAAGAALRTAGVHYWNPPLLMPLVELIAGDQTDPSVVATLTEVLAGLGKRPIQVRRDVPGFIANRLQLALLREATWIVKHGVASAEDVDALVRDGLARRWHYTGPFETVALGGAETFERIAANLLPHLSRADRLEGLRRWIDDDPTRLSAARDRRDTRLAEEARAGTPPADPIVDD